MKVLRRGNLSYDEESGTLVLSGWEIYFERGEQIDKKTAELILDHVKTRINNVVIGKLEAKADCFGGVSPPSPKRRAEREEEKREE